MIATENASFCFHPRGISRISLSRASSRSSSFIRTFERWLISDLESPVVGCAVAHPKGHAQGCENHAGGGQQYEQADERRAPVRAASLRTAAVASAPVRGRRGWTLDHARWKRAAHNSSLGWHRRRSS